MDNDQRNFFSNNLWLLILGAFLLMNNDFDFGFGRSCEGEEGTRGHSIFDNLQYGVGNMFGNKTNWIWIAALLYFFARPNFLGLREEL